MPRTTISDVVGFDVEALDGGIGKVDETADCRSPAHRGTLGTYYPF